MPSSGWSTHNRSVSRRVVVTEELPGERWLRILTDADCRVEVSASGAILPPDEIEAALVAHCRSRPDFYAALDVFEDEPRMAPGLAALPNVVIVPHLGSASGWTREGMATLAATNAAAILEGRPVWNRPDVLPFLSDAPPAAAPSIVNAGDLGLPLFAEQAVETAATA